jgi:glucose/arabinose dehydrogenase
MQMANGFSHKRMSRKAKCTVRALAALLSMVSPALMAAQQPPAAAQPVPIGVPVPPLGAGPFVLDTAEQHKIRVTVVTKGLVHPWALAFLPDGSMLVTERPGIGPVASTH